MNQENVFDKAKSLIGKKLPGKMREDNVDLSNIKPGFSVTTKTQNIDPKAHEQIKELIGDVKYRIKRLGGIYTQDIRSDRLNFEIDSDFLVTKVYWG